MNLHPRFILLIIAVSCLVKVRSLNVDLEPVELIEGQKCLVGEENKVFQVVCNFNETGNEPLKHKMTLNGKDQNARYLSNQSVGFSLILEPKHHLDVVNCTIEAGIYEKSKSFPIFVYKCPGKPPELIAIGDQLNNAVYQCLTPVARPHADVWMHMDTKKICTKDSLSDSVNPIFVCHPSIDWKGKKLGCCYENSKCKKECSPSIGPIRFPPEVDLKQESIEVSDETMTTTLICKTLNADTACNISWRYEDALAKSTINESYNELKQNDIWSVVALNMSEPSNRRKVVVSCTALCEGFGRITMTLLPYTKVRARNEKKSVGNYSIGLTILGIIIGLVGFAVGFCVQSMRHRLNIKKSRDAESQVQAPNSESSDTELKASYSESSDTAIKELQDQENTVKLTKSENKVVKRKEVTVVHYQPSQTEYMRPSMELTSCEEQQANMQESNRQKRFCPEVKETNAENHPFLDHSTDPEDDGDSDKSYVSVRTATNRRGK